MSTAPSILDELRGQYEAARTSPHTQADVEGYEAINARLRKAYAWLDKAFSYLDGVKPPIAHRFDVGHGLVFEDTRFGRGYVGQHERRIVGYPVLDEINIYYEIAAAKPLTIEVGAGGVAMAEKALDDAGLQYTCRRIEDQAGVVRKCVITVPPAIPAKVSFTVDYQTGIVTVPLVNVDRFDRVSLEFHSQHIDEGILEDLLKFILGRDQNFLRRAPLAGIHGAPRA
ncbi:MAG TPA: hypothetical protein VF196_01780 [Casimicrobiaceae bacterium]